MVESGGARFGIEVHPELGFVRIRVKGGLTAPEARDTQVNLVANHPTLNRLWDFLEANLTAFTVDDMRMFIEVITPHDPNTPIVRVAGLVSHEADYALARAYEALAVGVLPIQGQVFRDEAEAIRWVSLTDERRSAAD